MVRKARNACSHVNEKFPSEAISTNDVPQPHFVNGKRRRRRNPLAAAAAEAEGSGESDIYKLQSDTTQEKIMAESNLLFPNNNIEVQGIELNHLGTRFSANDLFTLDAFKTSSMVLTSRNLRNFFDSKEEMEKLEKKTSTRINFFPDICFQDEMLVHIVGTPKQTSVVASELCKMELSLNQSIPDDGSYLKYLKRLHVAVLDGLCGYIIGKYGSNIEKLKKDSGCHIKVTNQYLYNFQITNTVCRIVIIEGTFEDTIKAHELLNIKIRSAAENEGRYLYANPDQQQSSPLLSLTSSSSTHRNFNQFFYKPPPPNCGGNSIWGSFVVVPIESNSIPFECYIILPETAADDLLRSGGNFLTELYAHSGSMHASFQRCASSQVNANCMNISSLAFSSATTPEQTNSSSDNPEDKTAELILNNTSSNNGGASAAIGGGDGGGTSTTTPLSSDEQLPTTTTTSATTTPYYYKSGNDLPFKPSTVCIRVYGYLSNQIEAHVFVTLKSNMSYNVHGILWTEVMVPNIALGKLIGYRGNYVKRLQLETKTTIRIPRENRLEQYSIVIVIGQLRNALEALTRIWNTVSGVINEDTDLYNNYNKPILYSKRPSSPL